MWCARGLASSFFILIVILGHVSTAASGTEDHSILVFRVCLRDRCPHSMEAIRGWLWTGPRNTNALFRESSYGRVQFPENISEITTVTLARDVPSAGCPCPIQEMIGAADAARNNMYPDRPHRNSFQHIMYYFTWLPEPTCLNDFTNGKESVVASGEYVPGHEIGHNIGLSHAWVDHDDNGRDEGDSADMTTLMGAAWGSAIATARYSKGWIPHDSTLPLSCCENGTVTLQALHLAPGSLGQQSYSMLRIPRARGGEYHVSYRTDFGYDGASEAKFHNKVHVYHTDGEPCFVGFFDGETVCSTEAWVGKCSASTMGWSGISRGEKDVTGRALPIGRVVALHSRTHNRFVRMSDALLMDASVERNVSTLHPAWEWQRERFTVVDAGGGEIALHSHVHNRFVMMSRTGEMGGSPKKAANDLPAQWSWARFTVVETRDGEIALHSKAHNRFVRMNNKVDMDVSSPKAAKDLPPAMEWPWVRFTVVVDPVAEASEHRFTLKVLHWNAERAVLSYHWENPRTTKVVTMTTAATTSTSEPSDTVAPVPSNRRLRGYIV